MTARSLASSVPTVRASRPCSISSMVSIRPIGVGSRSRGRISPASLPSIARYGLARAHQIVQPLAGMTVLENCTVGACFGRENLPLGRAQHVVREAAEIVGLTDRLDHPAGQLTTGGKKRLELARALSARPELLLLDEVLAGLNPTEIERMITVIRRIRDGGIAILMIEHVMRAIMSLSDRIVVLNLGSKLAEGTPRLVANNPEVIAAYLGEPDPTAASVDVLR